MPNYTCNNANCSTGGQQFTLTSPNQTFCPRCNTPNALVTIVAPVVARVIREMTAMESGDGMTKANPTQKIDCNELIEKFSLVQQSGKEAGTSTDYIVKLGTDKRKRIDRQGPIKQGQTITHARFAVQLGDPIYAGIWMPIDEAFTINFIKGAFRTSLQQKRYIRLYKQ